MLKFVADKDIYEEVICGIVPKVRQMLWLATSDLKDLHVRKGQRMVPFLELLSDLIGRKVEVRLLHAKEPGPIFRRDFDRYPNLIAGLERMLCPRVHLKCVVVDGASAYLGSANLTGAGLGAKSSRRRNFESGIVTTDQSIIGKVMDHFDSIWRGAHCKDCGRQEFCEEPMDMRPAKKNK
jgi:phosphatidylserine/phosphatidylglycerophosphate/cardiolipin synthase-like enzyme